VEQIVALGFTSTILLLPYRPESDAAALGADPHVGLLAAQTSASDAQRFLTVGTYASRPHGLLARVVEDREQKCQWLFLLGEDPALCRHVLVALNSQTGQSWFVATDGAGRAQMHVVATPDWGSTSVQVFTPVATFSLDDEPAAPTRLFSGLIAVTLQVQNDHLLISLEDGSEEPVRHIVVVCSDGGSELCEIVGRRADFHLSPGQRVIEVRFFS
jgi:hypothetical protein